MHGGVWGSWLDGLARVARLHVVDLPGHGFSPCLRVWRRSRCCKTLPLPFRNLIAAGLVARRPGAEIARQRAIGGPHPDRPPRAVAGPDWCTAWLNLLRDFSSGTHDHARTVRYFLALQTLGDEHQQQTLRDLLDALSFDRHPPRRAPVRHRNPGTCRSARRPPQSGYPRSLSRATTPPAKAGASRTCLMHRSGSFAGRTRLSHATKCWQPSSIS